MTKIKITQTRSAIGRTKNQRQTLLSLGIHKIGQSCEKEETSVILGMVNTVKHLVKVEKAADK
ncbi:MAG: 50S ribosomal protein L30 [Bifidobacteriaceae bacterium]|jgi:large subunit ribosomal protein L30|nr:50S ribosomal protein L30 [Bifidobacteriaceae bacterium]